MPIRFLPASLRAWNVPARDALVLSFFSDERPLHGVAGLADWRLHGRLSRLIVAGHLSGKRGDSVMMPGSRRLPFERIFLFGLGKAGAMDDELFRTHAGWMLEVLRRAGAHDYALQLPGRATGLISARRAAELWFDEGGNRADEITIIDSAGAYKEMGDVFGAAVER